MKGEMDKSKTIPELEELAKEVRRLQKQIGQRRPLLIEFCGSPKSGKSTTINSLNIFLKRNHFNTVVLTERASVSPIQNKFHPYFNIWTLCSAIAEILYHIDKSDKVDIIIADRGIFDALCWFTWLHTTPSSNTPRLDTATFNTLRDFTQMKLWTSRIDMVYVFRVDPKTSIRREYANLLTEKRGRIMSERNLASINRAIEQTYQQFQNVFRNVAIIDTDTDTTDDNPNQVGYDVTKTVLLTLKELLVEQIGYFNINPSDLAPNQPTLNYLLAQELVYQERDVVEDKNVLQPIPIAVITNSARSHVLVVQKSKRSTPGESPERSRLLLYLGGHVRKEDDSGSTQETLAHALHREIEEEIGESCSVGSMTPFVIYSPVSPKSRKHVAVCYVIEIEDIQEAKFNTVSDEFIKKRSGSPSGRVLPIEAVLSGEHQFEPWSIQILDKVFGKKLPVEPTLFDDEL